MKKISLPVSKSLYIRKLICDFLKRRPLDEVNENFPTDVRIVRDCLARIAEAQSEPNPTDVPVCIDVHDCGAAYRFLMAVLSVTPGSWILTGTPRLLQRPIDELVAVLRSIGAEIHPCGDGARPVSTVENGGGWQIHGKTLHASELTIDCTRSGQFATALLLIGDKIGMQKLHILPERPSSDTYIAMTQAILDGHADLDAGRLGDWSAAVYWYARLLLEGLMYRSQRTCHTAVTTSCDALTSNKLLHLDLQSIQSDAVIAQWFFQWGIISRQEDDGVVIEYNEGVDIQNDTAESDKVGSPRDNIIELDMSQNLDLVPVLACLACLWPKKMVFNGVANLKYKESDRLKVILEELSAFAEIQLNVYNGINDNQLVINPTCGDGACPVSNAGVGYPHRDEACPVSTNENCSNNPSINFFFDSHNDHRFVMGFSLFALYGKVQIKGFDCVRKSYPNFKAEGVIAGTDIVG